MLINEDSLSFTERVAEVLATVFRGKKVLFVASTDMTHYPSYDEATRIDKAALEILKTYDLPKIVTRLRQLEKEQVRNLHCVFCGKGALLTTLGAAKRLGANSIKVIDYKNSGDTSGTKDQVVGYCAVAAYGSAEISEEQDAADSESLPMEDTMSATGEELVGVVTESIGLVGDEAILSDTQKAQLLQLARETVEAKVKGAPLPSTQIDDPKLNEPRGAFVTLKKKGQLRGCIGRFEPDDPLHEIIVKMAVAAATQDFRFPPVRVDELPDITLEISALTPLKEIDDIEQIKVGRDGIYIIKGINRGVLLPQVPVELGWDRTEFLENTCRKAGLPREAYKSGATIYTFSAEVFHQEGD